MMREDLRETIEQEEEEMIADETAERERQNEEHQAAKKAMKDEISVTKVELDKLMSTKLIIWAVFAH